MKTNVESLVFSITTLSATFPGAAGEGGGGGQSPSTQVMLGLHLSPAQTLTCTDHGDGGLDVDPLVCVDARVDEDQAVKVGLLDPPQSILDGVVVLWSAAHTASSALQQGPALHPPPPGLTSMFSRPL